MGPQYLVCAILAIDKFFHKQISVEHVREDYGAQNHGFNQLGLYDKILSHDLQYSIWQST
jgi:hypothetical protein